MKKYQIPTVFDLETSELRLCLTQSSAGIIPVCDDTCGEATLGFYCSGKYIGSAGVQTEGSTTITGFYVRAETPGYDCNQAFAYTKNGGSTVPFPCTISVNGVPVSILNAYCEAGQIPGCDSLAIWELACNLPIGSSCSSSMEVTIACEGGNSTSCNYQLP